MGMPGISVLWITPLAEGQPGELDRSGPVLSCCCASRERSVALVKPAVATRSGLSVGMLENRVSRGAPRLHDRLTHRRTRECAQVEPFKPSPEGEERCESGLQYLR